MKTEQKKGHGHSCANCGACDQCERCDHCGYCRKCGRYIVMPYHGPVTMHNTLMLTTGEIQ